MKARCGGPAICPTCSMEAARKETRPQLVKQITLTLRRQGRDDAAKELAFFADETVHDVIEGGRKYWGLPADADLRLCKNTGFSLESWTTVGEISARREIELVLVVR